jgi:RNA polymerase sigma-70 factor, ECF subfamily
VDFNGLDLLRFPKIMRQRGGTPPPTDMKTSCPPAAPDRIARTKVAALYEKLGPAIYARCHRILKNHAEAEDATQEVFLRILRHRSAAPLDAGVYPWMLRITTNYCLNVLRDQHRHVAAAMEAPEEGGEHAETTLARNDLARQMVALVPERLREPALLLGQGYHHREVAAQMGVSRRTVINRLGELKRRAQAYVAREGLVGSAA